MQEKAKFMKTCLITLTVYAFSRPLFYLTFLADELTNHWNKPYDHLHKLVNGGSGG